MKHSRIYLTNIFNPGKFFPAFYDLRTPTNLAQRKDDSSGRNFYTYSFFEEGEYVTTLNSMDTNALWFCLPFQIAME
jgi:hypothetical protein